MIPNIFSFLSLFLFAAPSPTEVVRLGEETLRGRSSQMVTAMTVHRPSYTRRLLLRTLSLGFDRSLVEILEPAKEKGVASLRVKLEMWNYLPKTESIVRVPSSMLAQSWMGSDFTNDDLLKVSSLSKDYAHREVSRNAKEIVIECRPKPNAPVVWNLVRYLARPGDFLPLRQDFFDESGRNVRSLIFSDIRKMDDRLIPTTLTLTSPERLGEYTVIHHEKALFDRAIPSTYFDQSRLKATAEWVKNSAWIEPRLP